MEEFAQQKGEFDGITFKEGDIKYTIQATGTGLAPDNESKMSLNMRRLFIKIEGDDTWYGCEERNIREVNAKIRRLGSPVAYILSSGYNEIYHFLKRELAMTDEEDKARLQKLRRLTENIEEIHNTCIEIGK